MENSSLKSFLQDGVSKAHGLAETGIDLLVLRLRALEAVIDTSDLDAALELREVQEIVSHWRETAMGGVEALKDVFDTYIQASEVKLGSQEADVLFAVIARIETELPSVMVEQDAEVSRCISTFEHDSLFKSLCAKRTSGKSFTLREKALASLTRFTENYDALQSAIQLKSQIDSYRESKKAELARSKESIDAELKALEVSRLERRKIVANGLSNTVRAISVMNQMFGNTSDDFNKVDFRLVTLIAREAAASNVRKMHLHPNAPNIGMSIPMEKQQDELIVRFATARRDVLAWLSDQKVTTLTVRPA